MISKKEGLVASIIHSYVSFSSFKAHFIHSQRYLKTIILKSKSIHLIFFSVILFGPLIDTSTTEEYATNNILTKGPNPITWDITFC